MLASWRALVQHAPHKTTRTLAKLQVYPPIVLYHDAHFPNESTTFRTQLQ